MIQIVEASSALLPTVQKLFTAYLAFYGIQHKAADIEHFLNNRIALKDSKIYLAMTGQEEAAGFIQLFPSFSSLMLKRFWVLNDLFVAPECRKQGAARALIYAAKQLCKDTNACGMMLDTQKSNTMAQRLYTRCGFTKNTSSNYYYWFTGESYLENY
jgi:ribosomal protein S18 acetylase RimI-like enzyme